MTRSGEVGGGQGRGVTVIGVGGAGGNAVASLSRHPRAGLRVLCANTDRQALNAIDAPHRLQLGRRLTGGLGAGADPEIGRRAAEEALPEIRRALAGSDLCIIAAGLGGGTGTGAAPVIAAAAREMGAVAIGIAIKPFRFEGTRRARVADRGAALFEEQADAMVTVCNEHLFRIATAGMTMRDALAASNELAAESARGFARLVSDAALKRVGLADLRALLAAGGKAVIGYGEHGTGADRALHAARSALCNPLLETVMQSAGRLLVTISGGEDLRLHEVDQAIAWLRDHVEPGADILWGATTDATLGNRVRVGIAATRLVTPARVPVVVEQAVARPRKAAAAVPMVAAVPSAPALAPVTVAAPARVAAPVPAPPPMERFAAIAPPPTPSAARLPARVPVPAPPPMELAAANAAPPAPAAARLPARVPVPAPPPMELAAANAAPPAPSAARLPARVPVPAPPPMELAAAAATQPVPVEPTPPPAPVIAEPVAAAPVAPPPVRAGVLVLDGNYVVNDRVMRVTGRPAASLADRVCGALKDGAHTLRRGAALHLAA